MRDKKANFLQPFNDAKIARSFLDKIRSFTGSVSVMEVCGTHTVALFKTGIRSVIPKNIRIISGPGCPVCVTPVEVIEIAIKLACRKDTVLFCFGDMLRIPAISGSLETAQGRWGAQVKMMYSPLEGFEYARKYPGKTVVLFGVGFETTIPLFASVVCRAARQRLNNLFVLPAFKLVPPALAALLSSRDCRIDGFLLPGHVSAVIGQNAYGFISRKYSRPGVIAGFETVDIVEGLWRLLLLIKEKKARIENEYSRFVLPKGNPKAQAAIKKVFRECDSCWRGLGTIPKSGLTFQKAFSSFNAEALIDFRLPPARNPSGCICGAVIQGKCTPLECALFKNVCTPEHPAGPCMVSSEGTCAAYYKYGKH